MKGELTPAAKETWEKCVEILPFLKKGKWTIDYGSNGFLFSTSASMSMRHLKTDTGSIVEDDFSSMQFGWDPGDPNEETQEGFWMSTQDGDPIIDPFTNDIFTGSHDPFRICYIISPKKTAEYIQKVKPPGWHKYVGKTLGLF